MGKAYWNSNLKTMGQIAIYYFVLSLVLRDTIQIRHFHFMMCVASLSHLFGFLTFSLKLFSSRIWVRRMIVLIFAAVVMILMSILFGYLHLDNRKHLLIYGAAALMIIVVCVFCYYVYDKIEKQNLKLINQKLADGMKNDME